MTIKMPRNLMTAISVVAFAVLYLKGISTGDFAEALAALLGPDAGGLSASTVARLTEVWADEHAHWLKRDLSARHYVYFWADGIHVQARLEDDAQCLLVIIGATPEGKKELVGLIDGGARERPIVATQTAPSTPSSRPTPSNTTRRPPAWSRIARRGWRSTTFPPSIGSICAPPTPSKAHSPPCDTVPCDPRDASPTRRRSPWSSNSPRRHRTVGAASTDTNQLPKLIVGVKFIDGIEAVRQQPQAAALT